MTLIKRSCPKLFGQTQLSLNTCGKQHHSTEWQIASQMLSTRWKLYCALQWMVNVFISFMHIFIFLSLTSLFLIHKKKASSFFTLRLVGFASLFIHVHGITFLFDVIKAQNYYPYHISLKTCDAKSIGTEMFLVEMQAKTWEYFESISHVSKLAFI